MMRALFVLFFGAYAVSAWGKVFHMDSRGDAVVEVSESCGEYKVICTFSPQTKFDGAVNAKFNDAKGDSLCKKGIMRYLNVGTNDVFSISGLYSVSPVKKIGGKLCYTFAVPASGCKVVAGALKPKVVSEKPVKPMDRSSAMPLDIKTTNVVRTVSYMSVVKYREVNGCKSEVLRREYRDGDFMSRQEFDRYCASEFARICDLGEKNFRAILNLGKQ